MIEAHHLYAATPSRGAPGLRRALLPLTDCAVIASGEVAAVIGPSLSDRPEQAAALEHARVIAEIVDASPAVIPFRFGVELGSAEEVLRILQINAAELEANLRRLRGRVEMGFKAALSGEDAPPFDLASLHALVRRPADRQEGYCTRRGRRFFEASYLIERRSVERFHDVLDDLCAAAPDVPVLVSGPWAPYSFCDLRLNFDANGVKAEPPGRAPHVVKPSDGQDRPGEE